MHTSKEAGTAPAPKAREAGVTLYDLTAETAVLMDMLEESEGEVTPEIEELMTELESQVAAKTDSILAVLRNFQAQQLAAEALAAPFQQEAERHLKRAARARRAADAVKGLVLRALSAHGLKRVDGSLGHLRLHPNNRKVEVKVPFDALPERFRVVTVAPDLAALSRSLKAGEEDAAAVAELAPQTFHVRIG